MANKNGFLPIDPKYYNTSIVPIYRAKITQIEMIRDRGYIIPEEELNILTPLKSEDPVMDFINFYATDDMSAIKVVELSNLYYHQEADYSIYVTFRFAEEGKAHISSKAVGRIIEDFEKTAADALILISDTTPSPQAKSILTNAPGYEFFDILRLQSNITKHKLQPKFEPMSDEDIAKEIRLDVAKLPRINIEDPIIKYYKWPVGTVLRKTERGLPGNYQREYISYMIVNDEPLRNKIDGKN